MPTLEDDDLIFRFPSIEPDAQFSISFMRTLRIPDTEQTYFLPPGFGTFPLRHVEDYAKNLPARPLASALCALICRSVASNSVSRGFRRN